MISEITAHGLMSGYINRLKMTDKNWCLRSLAVILYNVSTDKNFNMMHIGVVQLWVQTFLQEGPDMSANFITGRSKYECKLDHRRVHIWVQTSEQVGPNMSANLVTGRSIYECKLRHKSVQIWVQLLTQEGPNMSANIESCFWRDSSRNEG